MLFFGRILAPVSIGLISIGVYAVANYLGFNNNTVSVNEFYGEQFFSVLATLYAIITALVLVKGLESFDSLGRSVRREAMQIRSINSYFWYFEFHEQSDGGESIIKIRSKLIDYLSNVIAQRTAGRSSLNDTIVDDCVRISAKISIVDKNDQVAISEIMKGLDELGKLRADRISYSKEKIPGYLIGMLASMTVCIMLPFYLLHSTSLNSNYYFIFVLATFGSFIFFILTDINRPYEGVWTIDMSPYHEVHAEISHLIKADELIRKFPVNERFL